MKYFLSVTIPFSHTINIIRIIVRKSNKQRQLNEYLNFVVIITNGFPLIRCSEKEIIP